MRFAYGIMQIYFAIQLAYWYPNKIWYRCNIYFYKTSADDNRNVTNSFANKRLIPSNA